MQWCFVFPWWPICGSCHANDKNVKRMKKAFRFGHVFWDDAEAVLAGNFACFRKQKQLPISASFSIRSNFFFFARDSSPAKRSKFSLHHHVNKKNFGDHHTADWGFFLCFTVIQWDNLSASSIPRDPDPLPADISHQVHSCTTPVPEEQKPQHNFHVKRRHFWQNFHRWWRRIHFVYAWDVEVKTAKGTTFWQPPACTRCYKFWGNLQAYWLQLNMRDGGQCC